MNEWSESGSIQWCQNRQGDNGVKSVLKQVVGSDWLGSPPDWDKAAGEIEFLKESLNNNNNNNNHQWWYYKFIVCQVLQQNISLHLLLHFIIILAL